MSVATVIVNFGRRMIVETADGTQIECIPRNRKIRPVCGDRVRYSVAEGLCTVDEVLPADTVMQRADARGRLLPLAANFDLLLVMLAIEPEPDPYLIDKYLVAAEDMGVNAVIALNKTDLAQSTRATPPSLAEFERLGYPIIQLSVHEGRGMEALHALLQGHVSIVVGQSGVGKSSLIDRLVPAEDIRVGEISEATREGRHTTTATRLYHLPLGGDLVDSPGIRDLALRPIEESRLAWCFREFREPAGHCRFSNCRHVREPDCGVKAAVEDGTIVERRYKSYRRLLNAMEQLRSQRDGF